MSAVGRLGAVTQEDVARAARELGEFGRCELAEKVGLKPVAIGRFLAELLESGDVQLMGAGRYLSTPVRRITAPSEPASELAQAPDEPTEVGPSPEEVRDAAVALGRFTLPELCAYLRAEDRVRCRDLLHGLVKRGVIRDTGKVWNRERLYDYAPIAKAGGRRRRFAKTPEQLAAERFVAEYGVRGVPIAGASGAPQPSQDKEVNLLVAAAWATGWAVEKRSNHYVVKPPGADRPIPVPSTPKGPGMVRAFRDQLLRAGLPLSGFGMARGEPVSGTGRDAAHSAHGERVKALPGNRRPTRRGPRAAA